MKIGEWVSVDLCAKCGYDLGDATQNYWGKPCSNCGAVGYFCPESVKTSRRWVITEPKKWYKPWAHEVGYWEWSGKSLSGGQIHDFITSKGRRINTTVTTIVATGIASGLF